jgi:hypothetical protein
LGLDSCSVTCSFGFLHGIQVIQAVTERRAHVLGILARLGLRVAVEDEGSGLRVEVRELPKPARRTLRYTPCLLPKICERACYLEVRVRVKVKVRVSVKVRVWLGLGFG